MKLSTDKRNKLIAVSSSLAIALIGLWYGVVHLQSDHLATARGNYTGNQDNQRKMRMAVNDAPRLEAELALAQEKLAAIEREMPSGDLYSWFIGTIKDFKANYRVDIPTYGNVSPVETMSLVPNFPYKQVHIALSGTAFFQDFGKFLADFENRYPYMRVEDVSLDPNPSIQAETDREKLAFRMEIVALISIPDEGEKK